MHHDFNFISTSHSQIGFETLSLFLRGRKLLLHFIRGKGGGTQARKRQSIINLYVKAEVETEAFGPGTLRHGSKHFSATCKLPEIIVTNVCRPAIFQGAIYAFISTN